jgi:hypothetical protein
LAVARIIFSARVISDDLAALFELRRVRWMVSYATTIAHSNGMGLRFPRIEWRRVGLYKHSPAQPLSTSAPTSCT